MATAEVEDEVLGLDPTTHLLESEITGKESGLFVPSGTMSNLISIMVHCEVILGHVPICIFMIMEAYLQLEACIQELS